MPDLSKKSRKSRGKYKLTKNDSTKKIKGGGGFFDFVSGIGNYLSSFTGAKKDINTTADKFAGVKAEIEKNIAELTRSLNNVKPLLDACGASIKTIENTANKLDGAYKEQNEVKSEQPSIDQRAVAAAAPGAGAFGLEDKVGQMGQPEARPQLDDDDSLPTYRAPMLGGSSAPKKSRKKRSKKPKN
jgi:hypothetical protein